MYTQANMLVKVNKATLEQKRSRHTENTAWGKARRAAQLNLFKNC